MGRTAGGIWIWGAAVILLTGCLDDQVGKDAPISGKLSENALCFRGGTTGSSIDPATLLVGNVPVHRITFSVWIRTIGKPSGMIFGIDPSGDQYFKLEWIPNSKKLRFTEGAGVAMSSSIEVEIANPSDWNHVAFAINAFDPGTEQLRLFVNGQPAVQGEAHLEPIPPAGLNVEFSNAVDPLVNTCLDEAAFWNRTLSDAEIATVYETRSPGGLLPNDYRAYWRIGEGGATSVADVTGTVPFTFSAGAILTNRSAPGDVFGGKGDNLDGGSREDGVDGGSSGPGFGEGGNGGYGGEFGEGSGHPDEGLLNP